MYWVTGLLGLLLGIAPFVLGYSNNQTAMWTSIVLGLVVVLASLFEATDTKKAKWEYWVAGIAGLLAVIAPFVFGFGVITMAVWSMVILGALILILSGYEVFMAPAPAS
ncbi:MAG TPA: SPW repeat protein [Caldilineaceae bacterium]|nr:SPW repeat protein [Caldilineaceae bacterium]